MTNTMLPADSTGATGMRVVVTAGASIAGGDKLTRISFTRADVARLEVNGQAVSIPTTINVQPTATNWSFVVRGTQAGTPYLVSFVATDLCGDVAKFVGAGKAHAGQPVTPPPPPSGTTGQPALVSKYDILIRSTIQADYDVMLYRPRQFAAGLVVDDPSWGDWTVSNPGPYAGWDVLVTPNQHDHRVANVSQWFRFTLARPATVALIWRNNEPPPSWLAAWQASGTVTTTGHLAGAHTVYKKAFPAGPVTLPAVLSGGGSGTRNTPWILLAEGSGQPSPAPAVPAGKEAPRANQTCPAWLHESYTRTGPDGRAYATWHPPIDPVFWCYFRHEHGADPALLGVSGYKPVYGYVSTAAGASEPHAGFKNYVFDDGRGQKWLLVHHFGTAGLAAVCTRFHELRVVVARAGQLLADVGIMADFGAARVNSTGEPLTPNACPTQAAQAAADGSAGERKFPVQTKQAIGYEPWRIDSLGTVTGLDVTGLVFNTPDAIIMCDTVSCTTAVVRPGMTGTSRFVEWQDNFGVRAGPNTGEFFTDPKGRTRLTPGQGGAVRQFVQPGLALAAPPMDAPTECYAQDRWGGPFTCGPDPLNGFPLDLEASLRSPN